MQDLNSRIRQLTKLIVTSQTVDQSVEQSRPVTPAKVDFDMSPYQVRWDFTHFELTWVSADCVIVDSDPARASLCAS